MKYIFIAYPILILICAIASFIGFFHINANIWFSACAPLVFGYAIGGSIADIIKGIKFYKEQKILNQKYEELRKEFFRKIQEDPFDRDC